MHVDEAPDGPPSGAASLRLVAFEVVWIFLIFFLYAGSPPPDAGESHYLVKAKHYWDPAWCAGDLFLESSNTHLAFYWLLGWLTRYLSLDATTWILRVILWGLSAWAWRRLSWAIVPRPLMSLLTAGLMLLLAHHFHWAKELIFRGGVEGKTLAYVGVLLALEAIARNRWRAALLWAGAAGAFHVLVGGWTAVSIGLAWLASGRERPTLCSLAPAAVGGFILSLPGLVPSLFLLEPSDPRAAAEAWRVYVFERLAHHLVFHEFPRWYQLRHGALIATWAWLTWAYWQERDLRRLMLVTGGAVAIGVAGIVIDQGCIVWCSIRGLSGDDYETAAAALLRFYWFRLEDALLPVAVALALGRGLVALEASRPLLAHGLTAVAILAAGANLADAWCWRMRLPVPGAVIQQQPTLDARLTWWCEKLPVEPDGEAPSAKAHYAYWQDACRWIAAHTPADAKFITPRLQQTFKWNAGRAEVATRKDLPQDPASILAWHEALASLYPPTSDHRSYDLEAFSDAELLRLANKYGCQYVLVEHRLPSRQIRLPKVYPTFREENPLFQVYQVAPRAGGKLPSESGPQAVPP